MMAVRAPVGVTPSPSPLLQAYSPFPEHPSSIKAAQGRRSPMYAHEKRQSVENGHLAPPSHNVVSPLSQVAPSPVNSDTTQFEEDEELLEDASTEAPSSRTETPAPRPEDDATPHKPSLSKDGPRGHGPALLKVDIGPDVQAQMRGRFEDEPQSVIHIPSGFGTFETIPRQNQNRSTSMLAETPEEEETQEEGQDEEDASDREGDEAKNDGDSDQHDEGQETAEQRPALLADRPERSFQEEPTRKKTPERTNTDDSHHELSRSSSVDSRRSRSAFAHLSEQGAESGAESVESTHEGPMAPAPLRTNVAPIPLHDWSQTPTAQTRQDFPSLSRPGSSLASIQEGDDSDPQQSMDERLDDEAIRQRFLRDSQAEVQALRTALDECWTLCNTLATLSHIHRERIFNFSGRGDQQEQAWKSCWKLCQNLYNNRGNSATMPNVTRLTLDLCRDFCQALFDIRARENETADSVLRVSFELNNHLFNTHDRSLPDAFRERTLDFYITLCHRLMKQKSKMGEETDSLLRACWSLAEMLFNLRQNWREGKTPDTELLGSAIQSCWQLCDLFREGWTQIRPERKTPRPSQTTFTQAFIQAKQTGFIAVDETPNPGAMPGTPSTLPETPTTIFEDTGMSPEEAPVPNILVMGGEQASHANNNTTNSNPNTHNSSSITTTTSSNNSNSNPQFNYAASPHPSIQRLAQAATPSSAGAYRSPSVTPSVSMSYPTSAVSESGPNPLSATTNASTIFSHKTSSTIRTPADDPNLVLLKTLFVRAAVLTKRGYTRNSPNTALNNLVTFTSNLPDTAFGQLAWHRSLLDNYRKAIANDPGFKNLGVAGIIGERGNVNSVDIARAVRGMTTIVHGFGWLRDLYRFVFGFYIEDALKAVEGIGGAARQAVPRTVVQGSASGHIQSLTAAVMSSNAATYQASGAANAKNSTNPGIKGTDSSGQISRRTVSK